MPPKPNSRAPPSRSSVKPPSTSNKPASSATRKRPASASPEKPTGSSSKPASKKAKTNGSALVAEAQAEPMEGIEEEASGSGENVNGNAGAEEQGEVVPPIPSQVENGMHVEADVQSEAGSELSEEEPAPKPAAARGRGRPPKSTTTTTSKKEPAPTAKRASRASTSGKAAESTLAKNKVLEKLKPASEGKKRGRPSMTNSVASSGSSRRKEVGYLPLPKAADHIRPSRSVLVFGSGEMGQLGLGDDARAEIYRPRVHAWRVFAEASKDGKLGGEGAGVEAIGVGGMHTLAVDEKGRVWSWGVNDNGALGRLTDKVLDPSKEPNPQDPEDPSVFLDRDVLESTPMVIESLEKEGFRAVKVAGGDSVSVALDDEGQVRIWGSFRGPEGLVGSATGNAKGIQFEPAKLPKTFATSGRSTRIVDIACGTDHVIFLAQDGQTYSAGSGEKAQLGRKIGPRHVATALTPGGMGMKKTIDLIAAGSYHSFGVASDGEVYTWGFNGAGQCGIPASKRARYWETDVVEQPTVVDALSPDLHGGHKVIAISAGDKHSLFLFSDGSLWGCGLNVEHELGLADDHPATQTEEAKEIHAVLEPVQIFLPPAPHGDVPAPEMLPYEDSEEYRKASSRVAYISAGPRYSVAITREGQVYSWGLGLQAQLGLGPDTESAPTPALIRSPAKNNIMAQHTPLTVATGGQHVFILAQKKPESN